MYLFWVKRRKMRFGRKNHHLGQNAHFGPKVLFWRRKTNFARKVWFFCKKCPFENARTHIHPAKIDSGRDRAQKSAFLLHIAVLGCTSHFFAQSALLAPKNFFEQKSALFRPHSADAYKTNRFLMKFHPFWPQKLFLAQKCISARK